MYFKTALIFITVFFSCLTIDAQILSTPNDNQMYNTVFSSLGSSVTLVSDEGKDDWTFFSNSDEKIVYIDFETLNSKIVEIALVSGDANHTFIDNVVNLPKNTIYELDLNHYSVGFYTISLKTSTGLIEKELIVE